MFNRMLVITRGCDLQQPAVRRAALCAGKTTQLAMLDVVHEPLLDGYLGNKAIYEPLRTRVVAERGEQLRVLTAALEKEGLEATGTAIWDHPLDEAIARRVRAELTNIVVLAPAGGLSASDWRVVATCPVPVLVVKQKPQRKYDRIVAAVDPLHAHAKPAELDLAILAQARELQAQTGAQLTVVHCFTSFEHLGAGVMRPASPAQEEDRRRKAVEALLANAGITAKVRVEHGATHEVLARLAEQGEADLIVMGTLSRGRIKDWLIGSTAERVLHSVSADVLAVKVEHLR
jgi:universal stress protein E